VVLDLYQGVVLDPVVGENQGVNQGVEVNLRKHLNLKTCKTRLKNVSLIWLNHLTGIEATQCQFAFNNHKSKETFIKTLRK
jgi:hypothetical protein